MSQNKPFSTAGTFATSVQRINKRKTVVLELDEGGQEIALVQTTTSKHQVHATLTEERIRNVENPFGVQGGLQSFEDCVELARDSLQKGISIESNDVKILLIFANECSLRPTVFHREGISSKLANEAFTDVAKRAALLLSGNKDYLRVRTIIHTFSSFLLNKHVRRVFEVPQNVSSLEVAQYVSESVVPRILPNVHSLTFNDFKENNKSFSVFVNSPSEDVVNQLLDNVVTGVIVTLPDVVEGHKREKKSKKDTRNVKVELEKAELMKACSQLLSEEVEWSEDGALNFIRLDSDCNVIEGALDVMGNEDDVTGGIQRVISKGNMETIAAFSGAEVERLIASDDVSMASKLTLLKAFTAVKEEENAAKENVGRT